MSDGWIVIPNWDKFQHYKDRNPIWIKLYLELEHRDDWRRLSYSARGLLVSIWTAYAHSKGQLRTADLTARAGQRVRKETLSSLLLAGFIQVSASRPLALARVAKKEEEEETASKEAVSSREPYHPPPKKGGDTAQEEKEKIRRKAKFWIDTMIHELEGVDLAYVIADEFRIDDQDLVADLIAYAQERMLGRTL